MEWTKMTRDDQHIRKLNEHVYEVIDIISGQTRYGENGFFVTSKIHELESHSDDSIQDYVRLFGYASIEDLKMHHPDDPEMYIVEAIATVTSSFNMDGDAFFADIMEARRFVNSRWLAEAKKKKKPMPRSALDLFTLS
jgi:hypothetical protein